MVNRRIVCLLFSVFASVWSIVAADAKPGRIIAATPEHLDGATVTTIVYESTGLHGEPIKVSGFVVVPDGPAPLGGRPIVAWAHPTTGVAPKCAPSLSPAPLGTIPGLGAMLRDGFIVTATDYPGLGTGSTHPYLVGASEARAVLDSVRAARRLAGRDASDRFAVWGHSQGGHAALLSGAFSPRYAPELHLVGVAAAAPATELGALIQKDLNTLAGKILTSYTLWSWSRIYHVPLSPILAPPQQEVVNLAARDCLTQLDDLGDLAQLGNVLKHDFLLFDDLTKVSPWRQLIKLNSPFPPLGRFPVFVAQGTADQQVSIKVTNDYVARLCASGNPVDYDVMPGVFHIFSGVAGAPRAVDWMSARFQGLPPENTCAR